MKKKVVIAIGILLLIIIGFIAYQIIFARIQEKKLSAELQEISDLANEEEVDMDAINERLDRTVTKKDYAILEQSCKAYLKDIFAMAKKITDTMSDERITKLLTAENYLADGKAFVKTKAFIKETIETLQKEETEYLNFLTKETAMTYINDKGLDRYYIDLYEQDFIGDIEEDSGSAIVKQSIDDLILLLNDSEDVLDFLAANPSSWQVEGDTIVFNNEALYNKYNELTAKVKE